MPSVWSQSVEDILPGIEKIQTYTRDLDEPKFLLDGKTQDAVVHNLAVIGEAAGKLPEFIKQKSPEIEWIKITALRNILVHEYFGIDQKIVWDAVQHKLPDLASACRRLLEASGPGS